MALDRPLERGRERELELALRGDGPAEPRDELGERELEGGEADLECPGLGELGLPVDAALGLLGVELIGPVVAVGVLDLVERERVAVLR